MQVEVHGCPPRTHDADNDPFDVLTPMAIDLKVANCVDVTVATTVLGETAQVVAHDVVLQRLGRAQAVYNATIVYFESQIITYYYTTYKCLLPGIHRTLTSPGTFCPNSIMSRVMTLDWLSGLKSMV